MDDSSVHELRRLAQDFEHSTTLAKVSLRASPSSLVRERMEEYQIHSDQAHLFSAIRQATQSKPSRQQTSCKEHRFRPLQNPECGQLREDEKTLVKTGQEHPIGQADENIADHSTLFADDLDRQLSCNILH
jgi:hypothetical protein